MMASNGSHDQRGVALITVMAALLMCIAVVLASARTGLLQEMLTGNDSDQLRARAAAEALVRDAEADIRGVQPDGSPCRPATGNNSEPASGYAGCRERGLGSQATAPYFPQDVDEFEELANLVGSDASMPCRAGICVPADLQTLAHLEDKLETTTAVAATYGEFTRGGTTPPSSTGNPILASSPARAWYWVEAFRYDTGRDASAANSITSPDPARPFVYRITAVAQGLKPGTKAVVKSYFVPYPSSQLQ